MSEDGVAQLSVYMDTDTRSYSQLSIFPLFPPLLHA